ncbi:hypothetical protein DW086_13110 [Harryflintia acetispora]|nr:hypothetical protein DW086_13110 [Harryflintia acetispora]
MPFKLKSGDDSETKSVYMPKTLINKLDELAGKRKLSFSQVVVQCCEFALESMEEEIVDN